MHGMEPRMHRMMTAALDLLNATELNGFNGGHIAQAWFEELGNQSSPSS